MDEIFSKLAITAVTFAGKAAFGAATGLAMRHMTSIMKDATVDNKKKLEAIRAEFEEKIQIITPSIELIEIHNSKGNKSIQNVVSLIDEIKKSIYNFCNRDFTKHSGDAYTELQDLIKRVDNLVPYFQLAIITSGISAHSHLSNKISPSRLLQASTLLTSVQSQIHNTNNDYIKVGPPIRFTLYKVFDSSVRPKGASDITWTEKYFICLGFIRRVSGSGYNYQLVFEQDVNDGRYHSDDEETKDDIIVIDIENIKKIWFSSSGKLLNIDDSDSPSLVIKVDVTVKNKDATPKFAWYAFCLFNGADVDESDSDSFAEDSKKSQRMTNNDKVDESNVENSNLVSKLVIDELKRSKGASGKINFPPGVLSLFELLIRLASIESSQQLSHLQVTDEKLALFLNND